MSPSDFHTKRLVAGGIISRDAILTELAGGIDNRIYAVDGGDFVVRIRRGDRPARFASAAWAAGEMAAIGMPVPTVIWYRAQRISASRPDVRDLPCGMRASLRMVSRRRSKPGSCSGACTPSRSGASVAWIVREQDRIRLRVPGSSRSRPVRLPTSRLRARRALAAGAVLLPDGPPRLLHGDLTARHVIVDGGEVTGLVDLESVRGGDRSPRSPAGPCRNHHR